MKIKSATIPPRRWLAFVFAGVVFLIYLLHIIDSNWLIVICFVAIFLGATDYGRQCPLLLSVQALILRFRKK